MTIYYASAGFDIEVISRGRVSLLLDVTWDGNLTAKTDAPLFHWCWLHACMVSSQEGKAAASSQLKSDIKIEVKVEPSEESQG